MPQFNVTVRFTATQTFTIEADDQDHAKELIGDKIDTGEIGLNDITECESEVIRVRRV